MPDVLVRRSAALVLEIALVSVIVLTVVLGVVRPLIGPAALGLGSGPIFGTVPTVAATVDLKEVQVRTNPQLPTLSDGGATTPDDYLELTIPQQTVIGVYEPNLRQLLGLVGHKVLVGLLAVAVLGLLLLIVRTLRGGDPFQMANARRLYAIAALVGVGGQIAVLLRAWGEAAVLSQPSVAPYVLDGPSMTLTPLVVGLAIAVVAEVFRRGAGLREQLEGVV